jgi:hypothetical protein
MNLTYKNGTRHLLHSQKLADISSSRLGTLRQWIGVASLRGLGVNGIPEDYQIEKLSSTSWSGVTVIFEGG